VLSSRRKVHGFKWMSSERELTLRVLILIFSGFLKNLKLKKQISEQNVNRYFHILEIPYFIIISFFKANELSIVILLPDRKYI